jgi:hypothetical protein
MLSCLKYVLLPVESEPPLRPTSCGRASLPIGTFLSALPPHKTFIPTRKHLAEHRVASFAQLRQWTPLRLR